MTNKCVANGVILWQMNIRIYLWLKNLTNICRRNIFVYKYLNVPLYSNIYNVKMQTNSTNECPNIVLALKSNKCFDK